MANGTIHKLGTLYVANAKKARPTKPWYGTNGSAPSTGDLLDYGNGSNAIEIKDTDSMMPTNCSGWRSTTEVIRF